MAEALCWAVSTALSAGELGKGQDHLVAWMKLLRAALGSEAAPQRDSQLKRVGRALAEAAFQRGSPWI